MMSCYLRSVDYSSILNDAQEASLLGPFFVEEQNAADFVMMLKIVAAKISVHPTNRKFFDGLLTRSVRGRLELRVSVTKSRIRSDFLTCRTLEEFSLHWVSM